MQTHMRGLLYLSDYLILSLTPDDHLMSMMIYMYTCPMNSPLSVCLVLQTIVLENDSDFRNRNDCMCETGFIKMNARRDFPERYLVYTSYQYH